ncbi:hypothetical protein Bbelb_001380 [Branchiostoma belcheri]|nr:hypothetical protein Bbelb_001380 [Branchiostoma belcheri]
MSAMFCVTLDVTVQLKFMILHVCSVSVYVFATVNQKQVYRYIPAIPPPLITNHPDDFLTSRLVWAGFTEPARDLTAARPNCKSRSAPYHTPHGSRRATDRAPDGSLTETGRKTAGRSTSRPRQGAVKEHLIVTLTVRRTLGVMTPAGVYTEDMPNGRRFKCDLSIKL